MEIRGLPWQFRALAKHRPTELSAKEWDRLRALALWQATGAVALASRTFGLSRATLYRWRRRLDPRDLTSLRDRSRRPHRVRTPEWPLRLVQTVRRCREHYPRWGKAKLVVLLRREGLQTSASTVGRILAWLHRHGRLVEPPRRAISARRRRRARPYAVRKPREYRPRRPGDLVEVDTLDIRPVPGVTLKQFTARDVVSRWDVIEAHRRATAGSATQFLETLRRRMPFPIRSVQVDGGSEFAAAFEEACRAAGIRLFVLPPKSPKLNGAVERAQRTHTEEFYEVSDCAWTIQALNAELREWEKVYNTIRPHQALDYLTPLQFLGRSSTVPPERPSPSHMS